MPAADTRSHRPLAWLALAALVLLAVALLAPAHPAARAHVALALGILPLILRAMLYFAPVLMRRPAAHGAVRFAPWLAAVGGLLAVAGLARWPMLLAPAAVTALTAALGVLLWMFSERRRAIGAPHPGLYWYAAALICLLAGLSCAAVAAIAPEHAVTLRRAHLHLNTLGFIGLTAVGTLQVLLPTAGGYTDPTVSARLRADLVPACGGALLIALGAALPSAPLTGFGALLWLWPLARLAVATLYHGRPYRGWRHSAAAPLAAALAGFMLMLIAGVLHAAGLIEPRHALPALFAGFLLPLVSGAATQLLPVWLHPQADGATQARLRDTLARGGGLRGALFLISGLLILAGVSAGAWLAAGALALFLARLARFLRGTAAPA